MADKFEAKLGLNTSEYDSKLKGAGKGMESFGSIIKRIGGMIGIAFGVEAIISFSKESMRLAAEAEGVKTAFGKIGDSARYMADMMRATRGAMDDSDLMALAIKAKNFNIPLQDLSKYLEFATNRALTTGRSIGEMTNLIVEGLGSKSPRAMKELGLSVKDTRRAFTTTGGFLKLVTEELKKMGPVADTASIRMGQLAVSVAQLKTAWGGFLNNSDLIKTAVTNLTGLFKMLGDEGLTAWQKLTMGPKDYEKYLNGIAERQSLMDSKTSKWTYFNPFGDGQFTEKVTGLADLKEKLANLKGELDNMDQHDRLGIKNLKEKIGLLEMEIELYGKLPGAINLSNIPSADAGQGSVTEQMFGIRGADMSGGLRPGPKKAEMNEVQKQWVETWRQATEEVTNLISDAFIGVFESIGKGSFKGFGDDLLKSFGGFIANFGKMLVAMGTSMLLALTLMKTPTIPTAIAAIAAGGVAMAIGGVMMGMASKQASSMGSGSGSSGGGNANLQPQTIRVIVDGKIAGRDLRIVNRRQEEING